MNRPARIIQYLLPHYFPELQTLEIRSNIMQDSTSYLWCAPSKNKKCWYVVTTPEVAVLPQPILEGGLVHELTHVVRDRLKVSSPIWDEETKAYNKRKLAHDTEEYEVDREVITRGAGKQLLAFAEWKLQKEGNRWTSGDGLHPDEIRAILAKQNQNGTLKTPSRR